MCLRDAIWNVYNSELFKINYMSQRPWNKYCIRISKSVTQKSKAFASVKFLLGKRKDSLTTQGVDSAARLLGIQFSSVIQLCPTLCNPMNRSTPGLPVHHQLPESSQTHVHCVSDAIQPSHPLSLPSPPALNLSQHQDLFKWVSSLHEVAKVLGFSFNTSPFN